MRPVSLFVRGVATVVLLAGTASLAFAQGHQFGLLIGGMSPGDVALEAAPGRTVARDAAFSYQFFYAKSLASFGFASLHLEVPVVYETSTELKNALPQMPRDYSGLFVTPGLMLRVLPAMSIVPYVSVGLGFASFRSSDTLAGGGTNGGSRGELTGVAGIGGGVDMKIAPILGIRFDVRDFRSGTPNLNLETSGGRHNLLISGGIVLRF